MSVLKTETHTSDTKQICLISDQRVRKAFALCSFLFRPHFIMHLVVLVRTEEAGGTKCSGLNCGFHQFGKKLLGFFTFRRVQKQTVYIYLEFFATMS